MNFPSPRYEIYEDESYDVIRANVLSYFNPVIDALGFYPITQSMNVLNSLRYYNYTILLLG